MSAENIIKCVILLLFAVLLNIEGWRPFKITAKNITRETFGNLAQMNASVDTSGAINISIHILDHIDHPNVHAAIYVDSGKGAYDFEILNRTVDLCELFHNQRYEPLLQIFYKILLENGPWPKSCPIQKSKFSIENLIVDPEKLPPYLPERKGFATLLFKNRENGIFKDLGVLTIYFEIENAGINRLKHFARKKN